MPLELIACSEVKATRNEVNRPGWLGYMSIFVSSPLYFSVSIPPKRMFPELESAVPLAS